jgi:hypothetical protein
VDAREIANRESDDDVSEAARDYELDVSVAAPARVGSATGKSDDEGEAEGEAEREEGDEAEEGELAAQRGAQDEGAQDEGGWGEEGEAGAEAEGQLVGPDLDAEGGE